MYGELDDNERNHPNSYPPIEANIEPSSRLHSDDLESSANDTHQNMDDQGHELPATMWPQYFASMAAVLGAMAMGTTIGNLIFE